MISFLSSTPCVPSIKNGAIPSEGSATCLIKIIEIFTFNELIVARSMKKKFFLLKIQNKKLIPKNLL